MITLDSLFVVMLAVVLPLTAWVVWQVFPERVRCVDGAIVKTDKRHKESMAVSEIARIDFHYHAVVGFVSAWEFVSNAGRSLHIGGEAVGMKDVLAALEEQLPGFSIAEFDRRFNAGDVEDTINVWMSPLRE